MHLSSTIFVFILLCSIYVCKLLEEYFEKSGNSTYKSKQVKELTRLLSYSALASVIVGFFAYFLKQYKEHETEWSSITFLFGKVNCDSSM